MSVFVNVEELDKHDIAMREGISQADVNSNRMLSTNRQNIVRQHTIYE